MPDRPAPARAEAAALLSDLAAALPQGRLLTDPDLLGPHLLDWRGRKRGDADALLRPRSTAEVATIVRLAAAHGAAVVAQGGNTGLVGGSVPEPRSPRPTLLVSLRMLDAIGIPDRAALTLTVGAGAVLERVEASAEAAGLRFPLSLGSRGSATIGGLIATNAGGVQVLRHGPMRSLVLGLEAVLADGTVVNLLAPLRKDNSGYDIRQILIGSEGTLGIITAASLRLAPAPRALTTAWVGVADAAAALDLLALLRGRFGETVESFEWMGAEAFALGCADRPDATPPLGGPHACHVLIELEADSDAVSDALAEAGTQAIARDATIARSGAQASALWAWRDAIPEAERREGPAVKNDIAVPVAAVPAFIAEATARLAREVPGCRPILFGHLGDGNLHFNVRPPAGQPAAPWCDAHEEPVRRLIHDLVIAHHGSIAAEHGIGTTKAAELARLGDPGKLAAMRAIKHALDPGGILNPGKLFMS